MRLDVGFKGQKALALHCGEGIGISLLDDQGEQSVTVYVGTLRTEDGVGLVLDLPDVYYRDQRGRHILLKQTGSDVLSYPDLELKKESKK